MNLSTTFQKIWQEARIVIKDQRIKNHEAFVFTFCKVLGAEIEGISAVYDGRRNSSSNSRPNFFMWQSVEKPTVVFIGKLRFKPEEPLIIRNDIKTLKKYVHKSSLNVLASTSAGKGNVELKMSVSPDTEIGYFVIADFDSKTINQSIKACSLSAEEIAKLHIAYGSSSGGQVRFQYLPPNH